MNRWVLGATLVAAAGSAGAQMAARRGDTAMTNDAGAGGALEPCPLIRQGAAPVVTGRLHVRFQPDQRLSAGSEVAIDVATGADGVATVSAHAINTKGTGTAGRRAAQPCAVEPSPAMTVSGTMRSRAGATCTIESGPDGDVADFTIPADTLAPDAAAKNYTGHVTLMKRGDSTGSARVIAACSSTRPMRASYDLAVAK